MAVVLMAVLSLSSLLLLQSKARSYFQVKFSVKSPDLAAKCHLNFMTRFESGGVCVVILCHFKQLTLNGPTVTLE